MIATVVIDTRGCAAYYNELASRVGVGPRDAIRFEAARVLETCIRRAPASTVPQINRTIERYLGKYNNYAGGEIGGQNVKDIYPRISIAPRKKHHWWVDRNAQGKRTFYIMNEAHITVPTKNRQRPYKPRGWRRHQWSDERWAEYQREENDRAQDLLVATRKVPGIRRARGASKASFLRIAQAAGLELRGVPGYVRNAVPTTGQLDTGTAQEVNNRDGYYIDLINRYALLIRKLGGERILQGAVSGRKAYYFRAVAKGWFDDAKTIGQRYPGIQVTSFA